MKGWTNEILMWIFLWSGSKLFHDVILYTPDDDTVEAVHLGISEDAIKASCKELLEDEDE